jgi:hypothetical protein
MRKASHHTSPTGKARKQHARACFSPVLKAIAVGLLASVMSLAAPAHAGKYDTDAWDGKFRYGAFSTLISSHIMGTEFSDLIVRANHPDVRLKELAKYIAAFKERYNSLTDKDIETILKHAQDDKTASIYEEERSIVRTKAQNDAFIGMMETRKDLAPIEHLIQNDVFVSDNFQFSTHRALYNQAYKIPQNSVAGIINAYVAGIRSVEFDVLESKDYVNFVIHDLVTNRLDGSFDLPPKFVDDYNFKDLIDTPENILVPFRDTPQVEETGVKNLVTTSHVLNIVCNLMPELTLYADARNDAPVSLIRLFATEFKGNKHCRNQVVIKIYPFQLNGGLTDLVERYAERYYEGDREAAVAEIAQVNPHVLLAIGNAESESNEAVMLTGTTNFRWEDFQRQAENLPFSRTSKNSKNSFNQHPIFAEGELKEVEAQTYKMFRWTMGFFGITNPLVLQMSAIPSLVKIIEENNIQDYDAMSPNDRIKSAAHDNFLVLYNRVKTRDLDLNVHISKTKSVKLTPKIRHTKLGMSDRYPDFAFAKRLEDMDIVDQSSLNSFNYSMLGTVYQPSDLGTQKVRSTKAMVKRARELEALTGTKTVYATTDLPTDLRMAFANLLGNDDLGLPEDIIHRPSGIIKEEYKIDPSTFKAPQWSTRLSGNLHKKKDFSGAFKAMSENVTLLDKKKKILSSLVLSRNHNLPLLNKAAYESVKSDVWPATVESDGKLLDTAISIVKQEISELQSKIKEQKESLSTTYNITFVGERSFTEK